MKSRRILPLLLAAITVFLLVFVMTVITYADDGEEVIPTESADSGYWYVSDSEATYESGYVVWYEGETFVWFEGESFFSDLESGSLVFYESGVENRYETVTAWRCSCGQVNLGDSCPECGAAKADVSLDGFFVLEAVTDPPAPTMMEKIGSGLGCGSTVALGGMVAVTVLAGVCLVKRKKSYD